MSVAPVWKTFVRKEISELNDLFLDNFLDFLIS